MIVISLEILDRHHLLDHDRVISDLMELFPGTKVTSDNTYDARRNVIRKLAAEYAAKGKNFSIQKVEEEKLDALEKSCGPSKQVLIPIHDDGGYFEGQVCVSKIRLTSESPIDIASIKQLTEYLKLLNVGEIDINDFNDKENSKRLKQILGKQKPVAHGTIELADIPLNNEQRKALDLLLKEKIQVGASMFNGNFNLSIILSGKDNTDQLCKLIREAEFVTNLQFHRSPLSEKGLENLTGMPQLKFLHMKDAQVPGHAYTHLTSFPQLEELYATPNTEGDEAMVYIGKLARLKKLSVASASISDAGIQELENLRELVWLNLANIPLSTGLRVLSNFKQLEFLDLSGSTSIDGNTLAIIAQLPQLECFCLGSSFVTNKDITHLTKSKTINTLTLAGKQNTTAGVKQNLTSAIFPELAKMSNLKHLQISDIPLDETGIKSLSTIKTLQYLGIKDSLATDHHRQLLASTIPDCAITWFDSSDISSN